jgi:hypothetical protein
MYCFWNPTCMHYLVNKGQTSVKSNKVFFYCCNFCLGTRRRHHLLSKIKNYLALGVYHDTATHDYMKNDNMTNDIYMTKDTPSTTTSKLLRQSWKNYYLQFGRIAYHNYWNKCQILKWLYLSHLCSNRVETMFKMLVKMEQIRDAWRTINDER